MPLTKNISITPLTSMQGGMTEFYTPQRSDETMLVKLPSGTIEDLFVHRYQTDQILVVKGSLVLVILQNRQYRYINMSEDMPQVVKIPPGVPHSAINLNQSDCWMINAVIRHAEPNEKDYRPLKKPFPFNLALAAEASNTKVRV